MDYKTELKNYLTPEGKLKLYPSKQKYKLIALFYLAEYFEKNITYTEKEVNEILNKHHNFNDCCLLRRELFNKRFLNRSQDCSKYWVEEVHPNISDLL